MNGLRGGTYIHNGILLNHKKEQNNAICYNMEGTRDSHPEGSKSERERQIPYDITYIWNLIYGQRKLSTEKKIMDLENRLVPRGKGREWERLGSWGK